MKLKREKDSHMKPRTIDIDIVFFDDETIETPLFKSTALRLAKSRLFYKPAQRNKLPSSRI